MAKSRRTRRRFKRSRWSSNIQEINNIPISAPIGTWSGTATLATNPTQDILGVSNIYTVKNFDISFTIEAGAPIAATVLEAVSIYIMFVPQGMNVSENYNIEHPEYIMNYKYLGSPISEDANTPAQQFQPVKIKTRLSRKLNTGDSVILFIKGLNTSSTNNTQIFLSGLIRWWTKAN